MKQFWFSVCLLAGSLFMPTLASADTAPIAMLQEMSTASQSLNYELSYINVNKQGIDSLRYRHAILDKKPWRNYCVWMVHVLRSYSVEMK